MINTSSGKVYPFTKVNYMLQLYWLGEVNPTKNYFSATMNLVNEWVDTRLSWNISLGIDKPNSKVTLQLKYSQANTVFKVNIPSIEFSWKNPPFGRQISSFSATMWCQKSWAMKLRPFFTTGGWFRTIRWSTRDTAWSRNGFLLYIPSDQGR